MRRSQSRKQVMVHAFHDDKGFPGPDSQGEIQSPGIDINLPRRARPGRNGDAGRGRGVIPRYALASRYPGGMSANLAPGCDDAETGPRAVLAMMAAGRRGWLPQRTIALRTTTSMGQNARAGQAAGASLAVASGLDPNSPEFQAAQKACHMPGY